MVGLIRRSSRHGWQDGDAPVVFLREDEDNSPQDAPVLPVVSPLAGDRLSISAEEIRKKLNVLFSQPQDLDLTSGVSSRQDYLRLAFSFPNIEARGDKELVLNNKAGTASLLVQPNKITYVATAQAQPDREQKFDLESAKAMLLIASKNERALEKGILLNGSEDEQKILREAMKQVNLNLPEGRKIFVRGEEAPKLRLVEPVAAPIPSPIPAPVQKPPIVKATPTPEPIKPVVKETPVPARNIKAPDLSPALSALTTGAVGAGRAVIDGVYGFESWLDQQTKHIAKGLYSLRTSVADTGQRLGESIKDNTSDINTPRFTRRALIGTVGAGGAVSLAAAAAVSIPSMDKGKTPAADPLPRLETPEQRLKRLEERAARLEAEQEARRKEAFNKRKAEEKAKAEKRAEERAKSGPFNGTIRLVHMNAPNDRLMVDFAAANPAIEGSAKAEKLTQEFAYFARDRSAGVQKNMDKRLMRIVARAVFDLRSKGYRCEEMVLHDGYRTRATNARIKGAAQHSLHMDGKAIDLRIRGVDVVVAHKAFKKAVKAEGGGGLGLYYSKNPDGGFIHVDARKGNSSWTTHYS